MLISGYPDMEKTPIKSYYLVDFLISLSSITLIYVFHFRRILFISGKDSYFVPSVGLYDYVTSLFMIIGLTIVCFVGILIVRKVPNSTLTAIGSFIIFFVWVNPTLMLLFYLKGNSIVPESVLHYISTLSVLYQTLLIVLILIGLYVFFRFYWVWFRITRMFCLLACPFALLILLQFAGRIAVTFSGSTPPQSAQPATTRQEIDFHPSPSDSRVLFLLFDGLDYRYVFPERPKSIHLPEFDRLTEQAVTFSNMLTVAQYTRLAIPAMLLGKPVSEAEPIDENTLLLTFEGDAEQHSFSSMPHLFSAVRARNKTLSIAGFYHPYCRLFQGLYRECLRIWRTDPYFFKDHLGSAEEIQHRFAEALLDAFHRPIIPNFRAVWKYRLISQRVKQMVHKFDVDMIYVHLQEPHRPYIYNAKRDRITPFSILPSGYFDNLELVDRFLGELRRAMESAGYWDNATVIVTTDHAWRRAARYGFGRWDPRMPLLVKLPNQQEAFAYNKAFSPIHIKSMLLKIISEPTIAPDALLTWVESQSALYPKSVAPGDNTKD